MKNSKEYFGLILLLLGTLLAPIFGGGTLVDPQPLLPGTLLSEMLGKGNGTTASVLLIFFPIAGAGLWTLLRRIGVAVQPKLLGPFIALWILILFSIMVSSHKLISVQNALFWTAMLAALPISVSVMGRNIGPKALYGAIIAGCFVLAYVGILEYARQPDPNWRIFSFYFHPNALAGMLAMGGLLALGVLTEVPRLGKLLAGVAAIFCIAALLLTGSKGGLLAFGVGVIVLLVWNLLVKGSARFTSVIAALVLLAAGFGVTTGLNARVKSGTAGAVSSGLGRLSQGQSSEQSVGFRQLLWKSAFQLMKTNPLGVGIGTYRYHSAKPGITTQTQHAHSSFLQIGAEAGPLALVALVGGLLVCLGAVLKRSSDQPEPMVRLKAAGVAALVAGTIHSLIDSDFSHFGIGICFFLILGAVLCLSSDALTHEIVTPKVKWSGVVALVVLVPGLVWFMGNDIRLGVLEFAFASRDLNLAKSLAEQETTTAAGDGRGWFAAAKVAAAEGKPAEYQERLLLRSVTVSPSLTAYRALARTQAEQGKIDQAITSLKSALKWDPNNLLALSQLLQLEMAREGGDAKAVAERILAVESTSYYQVRAIPELVPTETIAARLYLAEKAQDSARMELLKGAIDICNRYLTTTGPKVLDFAKANMDGGFGGQSLASAQALIEQAKEALRLYEATGGKEGADELKKNIEAFQQAAQELKSSSE